MNRGIVVMALLLAGSIAGASAQRQASATIDVYKDPT
jgi:hypothetical protein